LDCTEEEPEVAAEILGYARTGDEDVGGNDGIEVALAVLVS